MDEKRSKKPPRKRSQEGKAEKPASSPADEIITLTESVKKNLKAQISRTGMTARALFHNDPDLPKGLSIEGINAWLTSEAVDVPSSHLDYVISKWQGQQDNSGTFNADRAHYRQWHQVKGERWSRRNEKWAPLSREMIGHLRSELSRTGTNYQTVLTFSGNPPTGLNARIIMSWVSGEVKNVNKSNWEFLMNLLMSIPGAPRNNSDPSFQGLRRDQPRNSWADLDSDESNPLVKITEEFRAELSTVLKSTSLSKALLLKTYNAPSNLNPTTLSLICQHKVKRIRKSHAEFLKALIEIRTQETGRD